MPVSPPFDPSELARHSPTPQTDISVSVLQVADFFCRTVFNALFGKTKRSKVGNFNLMDKTDPKPIQESTLFGKSLSLCYMERKEEANESTL